MAAYKPVTFTSIPKLGKQGGGVVWDPEAGDKITRTDKNGVTKTQPKGKALATFDANGLFESHDKATSDRLKKMGFKVVNETPDDESDKSADKTE